jgi:GLPGLI family protein
MKKILVLSSIFLSFLATAQMKEGKVLYERTIQLQFGGNVQFRADGGPPPPPLPPGTNSQGERKDKFELSFANNQSLWESVPEIGDNDNFGNDGPGRMVVRVAGGDDLSYHNFTTGKRLDEQELSSKKYIVEDSIQKIVWKMTGQTKTILGHTVNKVTGERYGTRTVMTMENGEMKRQAIPDTSIVNAWIAMDIPVPAGPAQFQGQLPGLILELEMNNGRTVYRAAEISPKVNASAIKEPKGKRITAAEFTRLRDKEFEEMQRNMPAGGGRRIQMVTQ